MIVTEERITVTLDMMDKAGMTRTSPTGLQFGIPVGNGIRWVDYSRTEDEDFDAIEDYFLKKLESEK